MKLMNFYRKPISIFVMVTFTILLCFWANQAPAAPAAEKNSETTMEQGDGSGPNFIEEESDREAMIKKPKKFPWLLVGAVVVVGAAALYFLVLKKTKYELTVTLGAGTTGTPATNKYKKGEVVAYNFSAQTGYVNLQVLLDGTAVAATGSVTMDKAHTITTSATQGASIQVNSTPAGAKIYLNNADSGQVTPYTLNFNEAATKEVLLRLSGYQDYRHTQSIVVGQTYTINATLKAGIFDDFLVSSAYWKPHTASEWTVSGGVYKFVSNKHAMNYSLYDYSFSQTNWIAEAKMKLIRGNGGFENSLMLLEKMVGTKAYGYWFGYTADGHTWYIVRLQGFDIYNGSGSYSAMARYSGASVPCIHAGFDQWNTIKVTHAGDQYSFYINNTKLSTIHSTPYTPHYLALGKMVGYITTEMQYDYVKLGFSSSAIDMPAGPYDDIIPTINWPEQSR